MREVGVGKCRGRGFIAEGYFKKCYSHRQLAECENTEVIIAAL